MLRSNGKFWFKAFIATITLKYDQILQMDSHLRPISLASTFEAPLGFGRETQAEFTDGRAIVRSGDNVDEFPIGMIVQTPDEYFAEDDPKHVETTQRVERKQTLRGGELL